jgi:CheY-like chemotaxis protein
MSASSNPFKILIVDDESLVTRILGTILRSAGYHVGVAANGAEGLRSFESEPWDLVMTDRVMPGMDGETMAAAIRHIAPKIRIILLTGGGAEVCDRTLFADVLAKPVVAKDLLACVANLRRAGGDPA